MSDQTQWPLKLRRDAVYLKTDNGILFRSTSADFQLRGAPWEALADQLDLKQASTQAKCVAVQSLGLIGAESEKALDALFRHLDAPESYVDSSSSRKCVLGNICLEY